MAKVPGRAKPGGGLLTALNTTNAQEPLYEYLTTRGVMLAKKPHSVDIAPVMVAKNLKRKLPAIPQNPKTS
jgi:hypothetical protein